MIKKKYDIKKIREILLLVFQHYGLKDEFCNILVDSIILADMYGVESHGIQRLRIYHDYIEKNVINVMNLPKIIYDSKLYCKIDANNQFGQIASFYAMNNAIKKAKENDIGFCGVINSTNFGMAGYYTKIAAKNNLIGVCFSNTPPACIYPNMKKPICGTNPFSVCIPSTPYDFLLDMSTTSVTMGWLELINQSIKKIENTVVLDGDGKSIDNSDLAIKSILDQSAGILPLGGKTSYKGAALNLFVELFSSIGGEFFYNSQKVSHFFCAINYNIFGDKKNIDTKIAELLQRIRNSNGSNKKVYTPGEYSETKRKESEENGIIISNITFRDIKEICNKCNILINEEELIVRNR